MARLGKQVLAEIDLEPLVLAYVLDGGALQRIHGQHLLDEVSHGATDIVGRRVDAAAYLLEQDLHALVVERQRAGEQRVQDHAAAPDVHLGAGIQLAAHHSFSIQTIQNA